MPDQFPPGSSIGSFQQRLQRQAARADAPLGGKVAKFQEALEREAEEQSKLQQQFEDLVKKNPNLIAFIRQMAAQGRER